MLLIRGYSNSSGANTTPYRIFINKAQAQIMVLSQRILLKPVTLLTHVTV